MGTQMSFKERRQIIEGQSGEKYRRGTKQILTGTKGPHRYQKGKQKVHPTGYTSVVRTTKRQVEINI